MWVKVDYSTKFKTNPKPNMPGQWAIYTKRHWWNKWIEYSIYADVDWRERDAKKLSKYPKIFFKWFG